MTDYKNLKLRASSNPHIRNGEDTRGLMLDVIIALMPALLFGVWHFGVRVAISAVVSVASAIFFEWLYRKLLHKPQMIGDLSAAVTGLLLSMVCPPELPVWMLVVGNFFAIGINHLPTLGDEALTSIEVNGNLVVSGNKLLATGNGVRVNSIIVGAEQVSNGEDDRLTGSQRGNGNTSKLIRARASNDSLVASDGHGKRHGANHDDSQYQCEYFFHCDFLL